MPDVAMMEDAVRAPRLDDFQRRVLSAAIRAPSGDNCQPWVFDFSSHDRLAIRIVPDRARSFFDYRHRATYLSVGAVIENIRVQAGSEGRTVAVSYRTYADTPVAAELTFSTHGAARIARETV